MNSANLQLPDPQAAAGPRFEFGKNWQRFLNTLDDRRIAEAERSLREMLDVTDLAGKSFLDVGSGSGLLSLAARRLGARVCSFDLDPRSVACTRTLKERYFAGDGQWNIAQGSVLDRAFLDQLGAFDVVYAWGVLHHTGAMWQAIENVLDRVGDRGQLYIAIYNHQPLLSAVYTWLKWAYVVLPPPLRWLVAAPQIALRVVGAGAKDLLLARNPAARYRNYMSHRGMSWWHDMLDWIGGYPFETARPQAVVRFVEQRGFGLQNEITCGRKSGCNQFVFSRSPR